MDQYRDAKTRVLARAQQIAKRVKSWLPHSRPVDTGEATIEVVTPLLSIDTRPFACDVVFVFPNDGIFSEGMIMGAGVGEITIELVDNDDNMGCPFVTYETKLTGKTVRREVAWKKLPVKPWGPDFQRRLQFVDPIRGGMCILDDGSIFTNPQEDSDVTYPVTKTEPGTREMAVDEWSKQANPLNFQIKEEDSEGKPIQLRELHSAQHVTFTNVKRCTQEGLEDGG